MLNRKLVAFVVSSASAAWAGVALAAPAYYDLGPSANVSGLSADGSIAAGYITAGPFFHWTPATQHVFVGGTGPGDGIGGSAMMSDDGNYISGNTIDPNSGLSEMSRYHIPSASWQLLGGIGGSIDAEGSSGWGISGNGQSVVGLGWLPSGSAHAIQWNSPGPTQDLGSTFDGQSSRANATNFDGNIVVGWQDGDGNWVVGQGGSGESWRYNSSTGTLERLGLMDPNAFFASRGATGVTDDGKTIVGFERDFFNPFGGSFGTIWVEGQGLQDLTAYALACGIPVPPSITLNIPLAIPADGSTIGGLDSFFNGFLITVPEAASASLLALAGTTPLRRRRAAGR